MMLRALGPREMLTLLQSYSQYAARYPHDDSDFCCLREHEAVPSQGIQR